MPASPRRRALRCRDPRAFDARRRRPDRRRRNRRRHALSRSSSPSTWKGSPASSRAATSARRARTTHTSARSWRPRPTPRSKARSRAGATEFVVRDSHGSKTNLLPGDVSPRARLMRGASTGPKNMMEGIDAQLRRGRSSSAITPRRARRTRSSRTPRPATSWISRSTACRCRRRGYNALVAGLYDVPVVFVAGDRAFVEQARGLLGPVEAVATKDRDRRRRDHGLSPADAQRQIRDGVERARARPRSVQAVQAAAALHDGAEGQGRQAALPRAPSGRGRASRCSRMPICSRC